VAKLEIRLFFAASTGATQSAKSCGVSLGGRGLNGGVLLLKGEELEEHVGGTLRIPVFHLTQGGRHEFDLAKAVTHRFKLYSTG